MAFPSSKSRSTYQFPPSLIETVIAVVDRHMPRCGDPLLDLAQAKTILADRRPMSELDIAKWELLDRMQQDCVRILDRHEARKKRLADVVEMPKKPVQRYGKAFTLQIGRQKKIVLIEDVQIRLGADGFIRTTTDFGPIVEKVLPTHQAVAISIGEIPESEEGE
jgi:hypothetical protein